MIHYHQKNIIKKKWPKYYIKQAARYPLEETLQHDCFLTHEQIKEIKSCREQLLAQLNAEAIVAANIKAIMMGYEEDKIRINEDIPIILNSLYKYYGIRMEI